MTTLLHLGQTLLSFVLVLGILVFVHEFGHFIVAKAFKIGVPIFSLGFGPKIAGFRRGETEYRVAMIPLGGYVRLAGDEADEARTGAPEEFGSRPRWQRFLVFVAGATFNIVLAILVMTFTYAQWGKDESVHPEAYPTVVAIAEASPAAAAGVKEGDKVLSIGGEDARDVRTREDVTLSPDQTKVVTVERSGEKLTLSVPMGHDPVDHLGAPGWRLVQEGGRPPSVDMVVGGSPAEEAGMKRGDRIVDIEGRAPQGELEIRAILEKSAGRAVKMGLERDGARIDVTVTPKDEAGKGKIGVLFADGDRVRRQLTVSESFVAAVQWSADITQSVFKTLGHVFSGQVSLRAFSGPIEIATVSREAVRQMETFFTFLAFISLQLGILNLMPIPVLDGGHIAILGIEGLLRRDLSDRVKERVMTVGFVFLLAFFGVVVYFDIVKARM